MKLINLMATLVVTTNCYAEKTTFSSSAAQTTLIELYSSEGCSSCPPADQFISQFINSDELWDKYIPMTFHVDYWDYLGWRDVFAEPAYSNRQRAYKKQGNLSSVYTPGFIINGQEWAGFFKPWRVLPEFAAKPGVLTVTLDGHRAVIDFPTIDTGITYNLAVLGTGLYTTVKSGENSGHQLTHDFVVLNHQSITGESTASFNLPLIVGHQPEKFALAVWVSLPHSLIPIQAVGGWLPKNKIKSI